jgi:hypothetical protein
MIGNDAEGLMEPVDDLGARREGSVEEVLANMSAMGVGVVGLTSVVVAVGVLSDDRENSLALSSTVPVG